MKRIMIAAIGITMLFGCQAKRFGAEATSVVKEGSSAVPSTKKIKISEDLLTADDNLRAFPIQEGYALMIKAYTYDMFEQRKQIQERTDLTDAEKEVKIAELEAKIQERVDQLMDMARSIPKQLSRVYGFAIGFGVEVPVQIDRLVTGKIPVVNKVAAAVDYSFLPLIISQRWKADGSSEWAIGAGHLAGIDLHHYQKNINTASTGGAGFQRKVIFPVIWPLSDEPMLRMGDLQGMYFGGALRFNMHNGDRDQKLSSFSAAAAFKADGAAVIGMPSLNIGAMQGPVAANGKVLHFGVYASSDGSQFQMPIFGNGIHSDESRLEELEQVELSEKMLKLNESLSE